MMGVAGSIAKDGNEWFQRTEEAHDEPPDDEFWISLCLMPR